MSWMFVVKVVTVVPLCLAVPARTARGPEAALPRPALPQQALPAAGAAGAGAAGTCALRRNIFSIRPVTAYPPTTLAAAKNDGDERQDVPDERCAR